jgi:uncharacterized protein
VRSGQPVNNNVLQPTVFFKKLFKKITQKEPIMRLLICCAALMFAGFVSAQPISEEMKADTRTLLEMSGALKIGEQMGNAVSQQIITAMRNQNANVPTSATDIVAEVVRKNINEFANDPAMMDGLIAIYAKYYTHEEILALIELYKSPLGIKMMATGAQVTQESAQFGQTLFLQRGPKIQEDIKQELQAAGLLRAPPAQE